MIRGIRAWWPSPWEVQRQEDLELKASLGYLVWSSQEERYLNETPITSANEESRYFSQLPQVCSSSSIYNFRDQFVYNLKMKV